MGNDSNNSDEWDDEFFLGYFSLHAATELALFSRGHVERLLRLAGREAAALRDVDYVHDL